MLGHATTLPVGMGDVLAATGAVARAVKDALVVADMPFGSYQCGDDKAMENAVALVKAGADAVKLEGGARVAGLVRRMTEAGIPVLAHVGMTPQSVNEYGGFKRQGKTREAADAVFEDAKAVEAAGAFAVTLEWLVMHDLLGLNENAPSFAKRYASLAKEAREAFAAYVREVESGAFPGAAT